VEPALLPNEQSRAGIPSGELGDRLREVGETRIAAMDEAGLDVQVISLTSPGLHNLPADQATRLQVETNDRIAELVNAHPDRFQGFATLAIPAPAAAAQELERAVTTLGLMAPCSLAAPVSATSTTPTTGRYSRPLRHCAPRCISIRRSRSLAFGLRCDAGFDDAVDAAFATYGIGWHYESGVQPRFNRSSQHFDQRELRWQCASEGQIRLLER
jgi:hypothetical protein